MVKNPALTYIKRSFNYNFRFFGCDDKQVKNLEYIFISVIRPGMFQPNTTFSNVSEGKIFSTSSWNAKL